MQSYWIKNLYSSLLNAKSPLPSQLSSRLPPRLYEYLARIDRVNADQAHDDKLVDLYDKIKAIQKSYEATAAMFDTESDLLMRELVLQDLQRLEGEFMAHESLVKRLLLNKPSFPFDLIMEIRAGTGGEEAALFATELCEMYIRYAAIKSWKMEKLADGSMQSRECLLKISGSDAFAKLRHELGVHRVQRIPKTEAMGRLHTSTVTVAVLPLPSDDSEVTILDKDIRIDTFKSSGPGGQHVNKTNSAVRATHLPTGTMVSIQDERCQQQNKAKALAILKERLQRQKSLQAFTARQAERHSQIPTAERSERIRTYNYPQNRITDHRVNHTIFDIKGFMEGELVEEFSTLLQEQEEQRLLEKAIEARVNKE